MQNVDGLNDVHLQIDSGEVVNNIILMCWTDKLNVNFMQAEAQKYVECSQK